MTRDFCAHQRGINKRNNYDHALLSLLIACHGKCVKNILRCKSVVCANLLGVHLHSESLLTSNYENLNFGSRFPVRNTEKFGCFSSTQCVVFLS